MEYNPLVEECKVLEVKLEDLRVKKDKFVNSLTRYNSTDVVQLNSTKDDLTHTLPIIESKIEPLELEIEEYSSQRRLVKARTSTFSIITQWFNDEEKGYQEQIKSLDAQLKYTKEELAQESKHLSKMKVSLIDLESQISEYNSFDVQHVTHELDDIVKIIDILEAKLSQKIERKQDVDAKLSDSLLQIKQLKSNIETAKSFITKAERFDTDLSRANNSYKKAMVHNDCEAALGDGSPRNLIRKHTNHLKKHERDLEKVKKRAVQIGTKASRVINKIIIDGSNLCFSGNDTFVGLNPLIIATNEICKAHKTIIVFDASIRKRLKSNDQSIRQQFNSDIEIHVCASKVKADETILDLGDDDKTTYVLSNDRFSEFNEKEIIINDRVIRHEILDHKIMIHELDINLKYG